MFTTLFFAMSLAWQSGGSLEQSPLDMVQLMYEQQARAQALDQAFDHNSRMMKQRELEQRFNKVAKALAAFGETWNKSHEIDTREEERLRKAWRELGKADAWFGTSPKPK